MSEPASDAPALATDAPPAIPAGWQPLSPRARGLFIVSGALAFALPLLLATAAAGFALLPAGLAGASAFTCVLLGACLGGWRGNRRYRHTRWRLDADGFALRRGRMWQSETRVPGSRVQHLDLKRGPLERHYALATLVIHTAGTRHGAVSVSGLDARDAERLRDRLARQVREDDDA